MSYGPSATPVASATLTYSNANQIASLAYTWNGSSLSEAFAYNPDHQRSGMTISDATYVPSGLDASSATYATNTLNQYSAVSGSAQTYDKRGNLTSDGVWTYGYDTENRLVSASKTGTSTSYGYDAVGRRLWKNVNGTFTYFASFGQQELAEYTGTSPSALSLARRFVYGPGLDEPVASLDNTGVLTYQFGDAQGSIIALGNASGQVTEKYAYTAYGQAVITGPGTAAFRYAGRRFDAETGLYHNRARAYSPLLGRFLQPDPIGTEGGINLYAYADNGPLDAIDPDGHASLRTHVAQADNPVDGPAQRMEREEEHSVAPLRPMPYSSTDNYGSSGETPRPVPLVGIGAYAGESIAARSAARDFTSSERAQTNSIGSATGCHTCGTLEPGTKSGNFVPDHQPPSALNSLSEAQRLYPQCISCSRQQGLDIIRMQRSRGE